MLTRTQRRMWLSATIALNALVLLLFFTNREVMRDPNPPTEVRALAAWFAEHPADWKSAAALADRSLDSELPRRAELWRASYDAGHALAPHRPNPRAGFVRGGLFHWYELSEADRKRVLEQARPLLRDDIGLFLQMHRPLYRLTRDFAFLRSAAPERIEAYVALRDLAAAYGKFDDYRQFRERERRLRFVLFQERRTTGEVSDLLALLPNPIRADDAPLVRGILAELDRRAYDPSQLHGSLQAFVTFALNHKLSPLGGLSPLIHTDGKLHDDTRVRLARASGDEGAATRLELSTNARLAPKPQVGVWIGPCSGTKELCENAYGVHKGPMTITLEVTQTDELAPYVELYVDDALVDEGAITGARTFTIAAAGERRVELRLANPRTRSGIRRQLSLRSAGVPAG
jgi:hypothetical protein